MHSYDDNSSEERKIFTNLLARGADRDISNETTVQVITDPNKMRMVNIPSCIVAPETCDD